MPAKKDSSRPKNKSKNANEASNRCIWTDADNVVMLKVLSEQKLLGNQADSGWKGIVWKTLSEQLEKEGSGQGPKKTPAKCQDHWNNVCS